MNINFQALGCRLNEAEVESWATQFLKLGHQVTTDSEDADLVVFNSCSVTAAADRKSRQQINRLHRANPQAKLIVTGCHSSLNPEEVSNHLGVDLIVGNDEKDSLVNTAIDYFEIVNPSEKNAVENSLFLRGRHRAFIKVQDGCRYRCTYCIVTLARGEEKSRSIKEIIDEINLMHQQGIKEIVLTGVHVGGYGSDIESSLYELLCTILSDTDIPRIRLASVEPWDLPDNFFELFSNQRLMPHMHLPIQSGCDTVLRRMARRCKTAEFSRIVNKARDCNPLFNITTDLIAGFPGETEDEWKQSMDFVEATGFGHMHIFPFSAREGTKAARLPDQLNGDIKKRRSQEMHALAAKLKREALDQHLDTFEEVLWERRVNESQDLWQGYTRHYHKILTHDSSIQSSDISTIQIANVNKDLMLVTNHENSKMVELNF